MSKTVIVIPDQHAHVDYSQERADWISKLIVDVKPDAVVNMGDAADMPSLSAYDKGKRSFTGRSYAKDIEAHLEFQDRLWGPIKRTKKKLPFSVVLEGNHEHRIERALDLSPELTGTISFKDYAFDEYYDEVIRYTGGTPGIYEHEGITYGHFLVSGVMGRPISGEHPAYSLLQKQFSSCTVGHLHTFDYCVRTRVDGRRVQGLVCGVYQDYDSDWAGAEVSKLWNRGVAIKRNVEQGQYDLQWVSLEALRKEYGT